MPTPHDWENLLDALTCCQIVEDDHLTVYAQVRCPKSKKKRIREKWSRNPSNWDTIPNPDIYRIGDRLVCHPATAAALRDHVGKILEYALEESQIEPGPTSEIQASPDPPSRL